MRPLLTLLLLVSVTFAGCSESTPKPDCIDFCGLQSTDGLGLIRGVVVDATITPMADVEVILDTGDIIVTDIEGRFAFVDLEPRFYELTVKKLGFAETTQRIDVQADDPAPPIVRILLEPLAGFDPTHMLIQYDGFIQCNSTYVNFCLIINHYPQALLGTDPLLDDRSIEVWYEEFVEHGVSPDHLQVETIWRSTQSLGSAFNIRYEVGDDESVSIPCVIGSQEGESPQVYRINASQARDAGLGAADPAPDGEGCDESEAWGFVMEFFSGDAMGLCQPTAIGCHPRIGVTIQQKTQTFLIAFYDYAPAEDWTFFESNAVPEPQ